MRLYVENLKSAKTTKEYVIFSSITLFIERGRRFTVNNKILVPLGFNTLSDKTACYTLQNQTFGFFLRIISSLVVFNEIFLSKII